MKALLGIDIGTSGTKTVLFDLTGATLASATFEYPMEQPQTGWCEQDPEDWWQASKNGIAACLKKSGVKGEDVVSVGFSGQMHGLVLLDKDGKLLRSSIIWCDSRTANECQWIEDTVGRERLMEISGNPALTGFTAGKLMWVKTHQPEIYAKIAKVLLPKDYVRFRLTGDYATDVSDASGMQFADVAKRAWSDELIEKMGAEKSWFGKMYESSEVTGHISEWAAEQTGLSTKTLVVGGGGDQAVGAVGNGVVRPGVVSATLGTSGVVFAHMDKLVRDMPLGRLQAFCHAVPGKYHVFGCVNAAGYSYQWLRNNFAQIEMQMAKLSGDDPYIYMNKEAEQSAPGSNGLIYLPYLMGERTPHLNPDARAVLFGMTSTHNRCDVIRAFMEGVTYGMKDCLSIIRGMGVDVSEVIASGGGGRSPLWRQIQADVYNCPIVTINSSEGPALGAAILAGVGAGEYKTVEEACSSMIRIVSRIEPIAANVPLYEDLYGLYGELYFALKDKYTKVKDILAKY